MYEIFTDSSSNLPRRIIEKYNIHVVAFNFSIDGEEHPCYSEDKSFDYDGFFAALRSKQPLKTSMVNADSFYKAFLPFAEQGRDILYVGMSSALSGTFNAAKNAMEMLKDEFECGKMEAIDTLTASIGEGLICYYAAKLREKGTDLDSAVAKLNSFIPHLCSRFSCEDLFYIKRGGRISPATAVAGTLMGIKPIMKTDENGVIGVFHKVRGRKSALDFLVDEFEQNVDLTKKQVVVVSHADCLEDAKYIVSKLKKLPCISEILCEQMEPVTSIHGGPGMIALFYLGKNAAGIV